MNNEVNWVDFLQNKKAIVETFAKELPSFELVQLGQIVLGESGEARISFNLPYLPDGCPQRWIYKKFDSLQFRFTFYNISEMSIKGVAIEPGLDVAAKFESTRVFHMYHEKIQVELKSELIKLDLYPYDSNIFEEPKAWFRV